MAWVFTVDLLARTHVCLCGCVASHELALRLQEEEDRQASERLQRQQQQPHSSRGGATRSASHPRDAPRTRTGDRASEARDRKSNVSGCSGLCGLFTYSYCTNPYTSRRALAHSDSFHNKC